MNARLKLFPPDASTSESREIVRRRTFEVRTAGELQAVIERLQRERFEGTAKVNFSRGGVLQNMQVEDSSKIQP